MKRLPLVLAVEFRPEEGGRLLQSLVGSFELAVLLLELTNPARLGRRHTRGVILVDVGLLDPLTQRFDAVTHLRGDPLDRPELCRLIPDEGVTGRV